MLKIDMHLCRPRSGDSRTPRVQSTEKETPIPKTVLKDASPLHLSSRLDSMSAEELRACVVREHP